MPSAIDLWLKRVLLLALAALLGFMCFTSYRTAMAMYRTEQLVLQVSGDITKVERRIESLEDKTRELGHKVSGQARELAADPEVQQWLLQSLKLADTAPAERSRTEWAKRELIKLLLKKAAGNATTAPATSPAE